LDLLHRQEAGTRAASVKRPLADLHMLFSAGIATIFANYTYKNTME